MIDRKRMRTAIRSQLNRLPYLEPLRDLDLDIDSVGPEWHVIATLPEDYQVSLTAMAELHLIEDVMIQAEDNHLKVCVVVRVYDEDSES